MDDVSSKIVVGFRTRSIIVECDIRGESNKSRRQATFATLSLSRKSNNNRFHIVIITVGCDVGGLFSTFLADPGPDSCCISVAELLYDLRIAGRSQNS